MILRISGLSLHTVRINPRKNCAPIFSNANHQQFCNIFPPPPPSKVKWSTPNLHAAPKRRTFN